MRDVGADRLPTRCAQVYSGRPYTGLQIRVVDENNVPLPAG